jgi:putative FmdB family regulatory protein
MRYPYECECGKSFELVQSMSAERPEHPPCSACGGIATNRIWKMPAVLIKGNRKGETLYDPAKPGRNQAQGVRTPGQQEQHLKKVVEGKRKTAAKVARHRKAAGHKDGDLRAVGSIPAETFRSVQRTTGDQHCWKRGGRDLLKKHNLLFEKN